mmetsp:Transcript_130956/g.195115  ORF Transcript_130956/g.195115 Transcript_130956/m.195115 type:complete len:1312 (-) Transcript_130956:39-3974(-)
METNNESTLIDDQAEQDDSDEVDESTPDIEEEEEECRVCRGPAEEGRPMFAPCKCSGSIGLTHQDCLMSWLEVTRGDGRCELCKTKFRFDPQYAENTPDHLPAHEVLLGLSSRALARWIPLALRIIIAASLWLVVAPLLTTFLYHGWMHRPSSILTRWQRDLIPSDIVSGAIIAAIVIISFLSLMSFADFLRVHWQQPPRQEGNNDQQRRDDFGTGFDDESADNDDDGGVDETVVEKRDAILLETNQDEGAPEQETFTQTDDQHDTKESNEQEPADAPVGWNSFFERLTEYRNLGDDGRTHDMVIDGIRDQDDNGSQSDGSQDPPPPLIPRHQMEDPNDDGFHDDDDDNIDDDPDALDNEDHVDDDDPIFPIQQDNDMNNRPFDPMDPGLQDDQVDMEINVALDELLGLRGPLSTLVRNLLWLLAFNATYLGIFAFLPKTIGAAVYTGILNTTTCDTVLKAVPFMYSEDEEKLTMINIIRSLNEESARQNTTFKLPDVATVTLGYFSMATIIVLMRYGWVLVQKVRQRLSIEAPERNNEPVVREYPLGQRIHQDANLHRNAFDDPDGIDAESETTAVGAALDATVAVVKVGGLLFLKMFLLPLVLGLWLDASTTELFGHTAADRMAFAGGDLFSFVLLHWVAGITFMLLVTVFLLQLREVAHPELLARMIRPQEPQPDLLGNLMHETVTTHMKRMFLSLGIYAPLLTMHVTLPVKLFMYSGLGSRFTFFHLNFWHLLMPKMQIPLELIIFHLSMLALLERYKNSIGGLQHRWMAFMCRRMGLTEYILPRSVAKFELYGKKEILSTSGAVDSFWYDLAGATKDINQLILSNIERIEDKTIDVGKTKENGQRVLAASFDYIRLPQTPNADEDKHLLPTKRGKFRLRVAEATDSVQTIEFWEEIPGEEIPRPPEGWDDLGIGGAYVQGRWAWANERKSTVEWSVAERTPFRVSEQHRRPVFLILKVVSLLVLSWFAITLAVLLMFGVPLAVGRSLYHLFRIPPHYIHDPLAFSMGGCLVFPMISLLYKRFGDEQESPLRHIRAFFARLRPPPRQKMLVAIEALVLWMLIAPVALGVSYEIAVVKSRAWFGREEPLADVKSVLFCWLVGTVVLHTWAFLAYFNVFTRTFWANIGNGILEPPVDENGIAVARNNRDERNDAEEGTELDGLPERPWQGKRGRVDRFFNVWLTILTSWDWSTVDKTCLLEEFSRPITKQVASALVGSSLSYQFSLFAVPLFAKFVEGGVFVPFFGVVERGLLKMVLFRICMAVHVLVQLGSASRGRLEIWFQAAHDAARDDRYLTGEILMNYDPNEVE